ncbi:MAG: PilT/PilU family type 4a pilus ATPase [Candidatus Gracilibacteria bacterium]|jgi:twitching motility protein PilT
MQLQELLEKQIEYGCSDLHLITGEAPILRLPNGEIESVQNQNPLTKAEVEAYIVEIIGKEGLEKFKITKEIDYGMEKKGLSRFRVTFYEEVRGPAIAIRAIPFRIPSPQEIGIPKEILTRVLRENGLILITGPNGSGKTTTLASLVEYINENRKAHIVTVEDPIEFTYHRKQSVISQRAVGLNTHSFAQAVKHTLRQDVNVVVIGEMRDLETIQTAITLAETGHLVLATLHTDDAPRAIQRIVDVFPAGQQEQIALQLSHSLSAIMSQRLLPKKDKSGRVCVREIMLMNSGIAHAIRARKISEIYSQIQINGNEGMRLFDDHLLEFVKSGEIEVEQALLAAHDSYSLRENLRHLRIH